MKLITLTALSLLFSGSPLVMADGKCGCSKECASKCESGKKCECKSCDCAKSGSCSKKDKKK